jgi:uncharacterized membrane protein
MAFLFIQPTMIVPILLIVIILLIIIGIFALIAKKRKERIKKMEDNIRRMRQLNEEASDIKVNNLKRVRLVG